MNKNAKLSLISILIILAAVIIIQNTSLVSFKALFWNFEASLIVLLILVLLIGIVIGYVLTKLTGKSKDNNLEK
ncbi:MAG: lipopolysaccharide assembly protein LapA domain-containing protein [Ignavibacteria bacterium]